MDLNFSKVSMTKQEIEYVKTLNLSPKMEALIEPKSLERSPAVRGL